MKRRFVCLVTLLLATTSVLAGCLGPDASVEPAATTAHAAPVEVYAPVRNLTEAVYDILPMETLRIEASADGIPLFLEVHRPDTEGPVPTILHSSPYNALERVPGLYPEVKYPRYSLVQEYVPRGYAVVVADVRGFGESGGCVEVWGPNEQQDQYDLVEWIAAQEWSDGKVGMIGASYPGTTPMEAAVMAPPHLTTIVAIAGLTDPYYDWHFGGVPNGESSGSPAAYQGIGAAPPVDVDAGPDWVLAAANGGCGTAELLTDAYQTDGLYTDYYAVRNLSARVKNVNASVLFAQGFTDGNVKPTQLVNWFNELDTPKRGFFGQWAHEHPLRDDWDDIVHAWFDHWLMGRDTGVMEGPTVEVVTNLDTWRADAAFPSNRTAPLAVHLDASDRALAFERPNGTAEASFRADRANFVANWMGPGSAVTRATDAAITFTSEALPEDLYLSGVPHLQLRTKIDGENAFLRASLYDVAPDGSGTRITFGALNLALRNGVDAYEPMPAGEWVDVTLRFQPGEYVVEEGHSLRLVLRTMDQLDSTTPEAAEPVTVTVQTGGDAPTFLDLPVLEGRPDTALPWE